MANPLHVICENNGNNYVLIISSTISALSAAVATFFAWLNLRMQRQEKIDHERRKDIKASKLLHPDIKSPEHDHWKSVLTCSLFNPSSESASLKKVVVLIDGKPIDINWSNKISDLGMPLNPDKYIEINGVEDLYIRRCDGKWFMECLVEIHHSFSKKPIVKKFSCY